MKRQDYIRPETEVHSLRMAHKLLSTSPGTKTLDDDDDDDWEPGGKGSDWDDDWDEGEWEINWCDRWQRVKNNVWK